MKARGNTLLRFFDTWLGIPTVFFGSLFKKRGQLPQQIDKIGIIIIAAIGDTLVAIPTISDLQKAYENAQITVFVTKDNAPVFSLFKHNYNVHTISLTNVFSNIKALRQYKLDLLLDYNQWCKISALLALGSGAKYKIGFATKGQYRHYPYDITAQHSDKIHEIDNYRQLVFILDIKSKSIPKIAHNTNAATTITNLNLKKYIVFHAWPSGYKSEFKSWQNSKWVDLAQQITKLGYHVILTGGKKDISRSDQLITDANLAQDQFFSLAGKLTLAETAELLRNTTVLVTVNTGIMHLGAAVNATIIALHGPVNKKRWGAICSKSIDIEPEGVDHGYLNLGFEYRGDSVDSMSYITVSQVLNAIYSILDNSRTFQ